MYAYFSAIEEADQKYTEDHGGIGRMVHGIVIKVPPGGSQSTLIDEEFGSHHDIWDYRFEGVRFSLQ
jgi:hypothetical protein